MFVFCVLLFGVIHVGFDYFCLFFGVMVILLCVFVFVFWEGIVFFFLMFEGVDVCWLR